MKCERIPLGAQGAYLDTYFLADSPELKAGACRPAVVVCPGGGYAYTSDREAEPIALALCARGFHACVLRYPCAPARFPAALRALAEAVAWVRAGAAENHVDPRQISVCGFSAGGHLAGSLGVFWNAPFLAAETGLAPQDMRPDKMVLCYPVITGGEFAHKGSFDNLLGADADAARRAEVSLEQHVTQDTPPAFLWHTYTDPGVPVENTMLFAMALRRAGVPFESPHILRGRARAVPCQRADGKHRRRGRAGGVHGLGGSGRRLAAPLTYSAARRIKKRAGTGASGRKYLCRSSM